MKQNLRVFMTFLMLLAFGSVCFGEENVTFKVASTSSVTMEPEMDGVTATYSSTYSTKEQLTKDNSMTLTIKGYPNSIKQVILNLHRNKNTGAGNLEVQIGTKEVLNKVIAKDNITNAYKEYTYDLNSSGDQGGDIVIKLSATENSLYCNSFTIVPGTVQEKQNTTLSFGETFDDKVQNLLVGETFTAPKATLSPNVENAVITYSSSNENVATVDETGAVTLGKNAGKATITAIYEGDASNAGSSASYTIQLSKPVVEGVFNFAGIQNYGSGLTPSNNSQTYIEEEKTWTSGNVTLTTSKGEGKGIRWWDKGTSNELRIYKDSKASISVPEGNLITMINFGTATKFVPDCSGWVYNKWVGAAQSVTFTAEETKNIEEITVNFVKADASETFTMPEGGMMTYAADIPVNYGDYGLQAYTLTVNDAEKTVAYTAFNGVVPTGQAVLLKGTPSKSYTVAISPNVDLEFKTNLRASTGVGETNGGVYYAFTTKKGQPGFKRLEDGLTVPAKKGYLKVSAPTNAAAFLALVGGNGETTGISKIESVNAVNGEAYNMAGQRVNGSYKGIVIKNGKKMILK